MRYMGGKHRQSKVIVEHLCNHYDGGTYHEPFVGAFGVAEKAIPALYKLGCRDFRLGDLSQPIIDMWRAIFEGWEPPDFVSEELWREYRPLRRGYVNDPLFAYCGHGASFGGRWFEGYARSARGPNQDEGTRRSYRALKKATLRKRDVLAPFMDMVRLRCCSYAETRPAESDLVYCDPPYGGRRNPYGSVHEGLDSGAFWATCREWARQCTVLVSEFHAPAGITELHCWGHTIANHHNKSKRLDAKEYLMKLEAT